TRPEWQPGGGGLCLHSIVPWPGDPSRLALAMSAVGVWLTEDGGGTWAHGNDGLHAGYLPEDPPPSLTFFLPHLHPAPPTPARLAGRSACSCSSTAGCTAPTTRAPRGPRSARGCRRTSASRWPSTRPIPTART